MSNLPVYVSSGAAEYRSMVITETAGVDIHTDAVMMALIPDDQDSPLDADWQAPDRTIHGVNTAVVTVSILVDDSFDPGKYRRWAKITDSPEVAPLRGGHVIVI